MGVGKACYILSLDQGTTSSRAVLYSENGNELRSASRQLPNAFPHAGWVEQDPEEIWASQRESLLEVASGIPPEEVAAIGITNQRETTVCWERSSGRALAPAIVWQCRRSAEICERMRARGFESEIRRRTGLVLDAYFSASKIVWLFENIAGLRERAQRGEVCFGTVDTWLLWKLTEGRTFATDTSNASRTMLYSLRECDWDADLLTMFDVPRSALAEVRHSSGNFGTTNILGAPVPISGVLGDQQASLLGNGCIQKESVKCTFGTGAFLLLNLGAEIKESKHGLLTTALWHFEAKPQFAHEGSVFIAGALIQWLRDGLEIVKSASEIEALAASVPDSAGCIIMPAFVGLGAPHWKSGVRGAMFGLTRDTGRAHIARAALEAVAHQIADLAECDEFRNVKTLNIDGGMSANALFCQILADLSGLEIAVAARREMTAFGAAAIAAFGAGVIESFAEIGDSFAPGGDGVKKFSPILSSNQRSQQRGWWKAVLQKL